MNRTTGELLIRLLQALYQQILADDFTKALSALEGITSFVRYLTTPETPAPTVEDEIKIVQQLFHIYALEDNYIFSINYHQIDKYRVIPHASLLCEICYHGIELIHSGCSLSGVIISESNQQITYHLIDSCGCIYGGTINDSSLQNNSCAKFTE